MPTLRVALALLLAAAPLAAQTSDGSGQDAWSRLAARVAAYLGSGPVRRARPAVAIMAVRGGAPRDLGEDLDARLLDRALGLRAQLLSGKGGETDREQLRGVYAALAVSYWSQTLGQDASADADAQASASLKKWAAERPSLAPALASALSSAGAGFDEKKLVAADWGGYCRALTPPRPDLAAPGLEGAAAVFDRKTARLDELLGRLRAAWTTKALTGADRARAYLLAGQTALALSQAPFRVAQDAPTASSAEAAPVAVTTGRRPPAAAAPAEPLFSPKAIYDQAAPSVVLIMCGAQDGAAGEIGSGSIVDARGRVLTNAHVVIRDATRQPWPTIRVYFKPARMTGDPAKDLANPVTARLLAYDPTLDLALLDVGAPPAGTGVLGFGDPERVEIGDRVAAIGHPEQGGLWTLTTGIVSAFVADLGGVRGRAAFQTDASINRGNSGGPLLDAAGRIIGVNTLMSRKAADGLTITAVNFAIRADVARRWLAAHGVAAEQATQAVAKAAPATAPGPADAPPVKTVMVTESRPYDADELLREQMKELDDLGQDMENEIEERRPQ